MHKKSAGVKHYLATTGAHNPEQATLTLPGSPISRRFYGTDDREEK